MGLYVALAERLKRRSAKSDTEDRSLYATLIFTPVLAAPSKRWVHKWINAGSIPARGVNNMEVR